jgi:GT2 family glycosyltransferase
MIDKIGFFDDDFFAYCEDTDLGLRGRIAGWRAVLARDAIVFHRYSRSGGEFSPFKLYLVERNHFWVALKSFPVSMLLTLPFWTMARYLVQAQLVLRSKGAGAQFRSTSSSSLITALLKGVWDAARSLPDLIRKRGRVMATRRLSAGEMSLLIHSSSITFVELLDAG